MTPDVKSEPTSLFSRLDERALDKPLRVRVEREQRIAFCKLLKIGLF